MIHGLQIMTHMPLSNIKFPANAEGFNGFMMQIAVFDIIPADYILDKVVYFPQEDPFNLNFELLDFKSIYAVPNLGTIFFMFLTFILLVPVSCLITCWAFKLRELRKYDKQLKEFLMWGGTVRFLMESYMELLLAACLNVLMFDNTSGYIGVAFSNYYALFFFVITVGFPIWIILFYLLKIDQWEDEEFERKWGTVLEGTR